MIPPSPRSLSCLPISLMALIFTCVIVSSRELVFSDEFPGVDVDCHQRLGLIDNDVRSVLEPNFAFQCVFDFGSHAECVQNGSGFGVQPDPVHEVGVEGTDKLDNPLVDLLAVHPDRPEIVGESITDGSFDQPRL